ncbi:MAG: tRNA (N(6)-L-threonylcarbamoyladenosine(37)-C(2))-methylthiotransferase MtaB [Patescibacteria group bacterium]
MKISFFTLGCKLNQAETDELKKELQKMGFLAVPFKAKANIAVVRACAVTCGASRTTRETIRQAKRRGAYVIATGCLEHKNLPEIDFMAKNNEEVIKHLQTVILNGTKCSEESLSAHQNDPTEILRFAQDDKTTEPIDRTRAFIKIQTGCNFNCAYCVIPSFRGRAESVPTKEIIKKIKQAEKEGYKEVILTGVNVCQYRNDSHHPAPLLHKEGAINLAGLLKRILTETKIPRIRLGSLDPRLISDEFIKLFSNPRLLPHWHLSLQSGSDEILKKMRRGYTAKQYQTIVKKIRAKNPLFSLTTDIIAGFPGETAKDFKATCNFVKKINFTKIHVFPFSPRPGTDAAKMPGAAQDKIKTERVKKLIKIANSTSREFIKKFIGLSRPVLFEHKKTALSGGYAPEYFTVKYKSSKNLQNKIVEVKLASSSILQ